MLLAVPRQAASSEQSSTKQLALFRLFDGVEPGAHGSGGDACWADFDLARSLSPDDFGRIEEELRRIVEADLPLERQRLTADEATAELRHQRSRLRAELLADRGQPFADFVRLGECFEPCGTALLPSTGALAAFRLLSVSGAYFKDDETRPMLQRLWAAAFFDEAALRRYLVTREQAKQRDHRKLGPRLQLFALLPECPALPFWLPRGVAVLQVMRHYLRVRYAEAGYQEIRTPEILPESYWRASGHWEHYRERMFVTHTEDASYAVRPMNCPGAILVYRLAERSYRELPLRLAELGRVHRNEKSGTLHGLLRLREFTQDDGHVFVAEEGLRRELVHTLQMVRRVYADFGFERYHVELSTRPPGASGSTEQWEAAEGALVAALEEVGLAYQTERGEGAFYGPKIDFHIEDCLGRDWQCGTIQVDCASPVRFELSYTAPEGRARRPVLIHRAILGSLERFLGILLEHTAGVLPLWLAPVQVRVLPVAEERHAPAVHAAVALLRRRHIRAEADVRARPLQALVRHAEEEQVPLVVVIGDSEAEDGTYAVRERHAGERGWMTPDEFVAAFEWYGPPRGETA